MARPTKQGIDYFPLDCQFDDKIEMYLIEKGAVGLGILISIWQMIYSNEGYYIENGKDLYLLIKRKINVDINEVLDCINVCLDRNIFDYSIHKRNKILTSKAIQKRYFEAGKKKKEVKIIKKFMLIDVSAYDNLVNVDINSINVGGNATNVNVKEEVEEEVKVNSKILFGEFVKLTKEEHQKLVDKYESEFVDACIERLDNYIGSNGKKYKSHYRTILSWVASAEMKTGEWVK